MTDQETIARFIMLRAQGWSFHAISVELKVSKPTLIKWSRQHQFDIQDLRATETEALADRIFQRRQRRWETLAKHLARIEEAIDSLEIEEIPASRLYGIAASLRAEINGEIGKPEFSETTKHIPQEEFVYDTESWKF